MPSDSEQRLRPPSYRGCWHGVSRHFLSLWSARRLLTYTGSYSVTVVYNPKAFILHAASLHQAFAHCGRFSTAASRRSLGSVSVPVWRIILSDPLPVIALVSRYLTNKLIGRNPLPQQQPKPPFTFGRMSFLGPFSIIHRFQWLSRSEGYVGYVLLTLSPLYSSEDFRARLACLIHAASVRSEPGSNPSIEFV